MTKAKGSKSGLRVKSYTHTRNENKEKKEKIEEWLQAQRKRNDIMFNGNEKIRRVAIV